MFSLTITGLGRVITRGENAQEILRGDDENWEYLEKWRLAHVKEIQDRIFNTEKFVKRWWRLTNQERLTNQDREQHDLELLNQVDQKCYGPIRHKINQVMILLGRIMDNLSTAREYAERSIQEDNPEQTPVTTLIEWAAVVKGMSEGMSAALRARFEEK